MRAKEYLELHKVSIKHMEEVSHIVADLMPLRLNKQATDEYYNHRLSADIRRRDFLLRTELYEQGNAMQKERPVLEVLDKEIPVEIAAEIREVLFEVITGDESFGYLYFLLGTEQNAKHRTNPIDCIPDRKRIESAIKRYRDDYPKALLDEYLNDELNYSQYDRLTSGHYMKDDEQKMLHYFNRVFEVYDKLRLCKQSVSGVRNFLKSLQFEDDIQRYWTLDFIVRLIERYEYDDVQLIRCKKEIEKIIRPQHPDKKDDTKSEVYLNLRKGTKLDFIRVVNTLYELGLFADKTGGKITKKTVFTTLGNALNLDLSAYDKDLSRSLADSTALEKHLKIFKEMQQCMTDIFNSK